MINLPGGSKWRFTLLPLWLVMIFALVASSCVGFSPASMEGEETGTWPDSQVPAPEVGHPAPDFTLNDLDGNPVKLSDLRGKVVFINFWATWCPSCRAEMPEIEAAYQKYREAGVMVIGVDIAEPKSVVRQYVEEGGFSWTFVLDSTGEVSRDYQVVEIPTSFFLDREGIIRTVSIGAMRREAIEAKLAVAMR
ncbi:MAG: TlpA disulfide reductase family protein [Dehalococcoidales bacterium]|nr:TlpA disulfide reductase family protein [Dehalococcoidales bacterium]